MSRSLYFLTVITLGLSMGVGPRAAAKGGGSTLTNYPAKIVFQDRPGDAIASDGKGAYTNGVDGVTAVFQVQSDGSNQFLLKFGAVKGKVVRSIRYAYTSGAATSCDGSPADNPVATINDSGYVDFLNVASMTAGVTIAKQGGFHTSAGTFRFPDATKLDPVNPYHCGALLVVTRLNNTVWAVTTDTTAGQVYVNSAGTVVFTANPEEVGSLAQLDLDATHGFEGNYRMPFFATISCLSATACPAAR